MVRRHQLFSSLSNFLTFFLLLTFHFTTVFTCLVFRNSFFSVCCLSTGSCHAPFLPRFRPFIFRSSLSHSLNSLTVALSTLIPVSRAPIPIESPSYHLLHIFSALKNKKYRLTFSKRTRRPFEPKIKQMNSPLPFKYEENQFLNVKCEFLSLGF